jgi:predicted unusual protein kinase regulating ubiquinone biosynthesis (AarF/ABC1/UbiB family)
VSAWRRFMRRLTIYQLVARITAEIIWLDRQRSHRTADEMVALESAVFRRQAIRLRETALQLQGLLVKLGQFLSTRVDILPEEFTSELAGLQDMVPPVPWPEVAHQLRAELGADAATAFASLEHVPVASASLGQVHRGRLPDGREVAVKVQRPGIEALVGADLDAVRRVMQVAQRWTRWSRRVDLPALFGELERTTREELDYVVEADHADEFRRLFAASNEIVVPQVLRDHLTHRVLIMEFVGGLRITDRAGMLAAGLDPHDVVERLVRTYLQQVLRDGFFHADPHPGNLFVDPRGRLIFVDFGMMGRIPPEHRATFGRLVGAVVRRDSDALVAAVRDLGFVRAHADDVMLKRGLSVALDQLSGVPFDQPGSAAFQAFLDEMREFLYTEPFQLPSQYAFLGRAISILQGIAAGLDPQADMVALLRASALPYLHLDSGGGAAGAAGLTWELVWREIRDTALLLYRLPRRLDKLATQVSEGQINVRVELAGLHRRLDRQSRAVRRVGVAVLAAAACLSATWLTVAGRGLPADLLWAGAGLLALWSLR